LTLWRSRWNGPQMLAISPYWHYDGSADITYGPCDGTHTYWSLLQKNGGNHKFSQSNTITC
jgi:hypothetical protein